MYVVSFNLDLSNLLLILRLENFGLALSLLFDTLDLRLEFLYGSLGILKLTLKSGGVC